MNHNPNCLACGPENPINFGLVLQPDGETMNATITPDERLEGAPGLLHGGAMATIIDETLGTLTDHIGAEGVTARLCVDYRSPVPLGRELKVHGWLAHKEGRKLYVRATVHQEDRLVAEAEGLWVVIADDHYERARAL